MTSRLMLFFMLFLSAQSLFARELIIVSDLDETLRMANVEVKAKAALKLITGVKPYEGLKAIFNELGQNQEAKFYYLSNSYNFTYSGKKWTQKHGLPKGTVFQRTLKDDSDSFKPTKLREIVAAHPDASFLFFGDNIERDPKFYKDLVAEVPVDARIFIRDARLIFPYDSQITHYQTEEQITDDLNMSLQTSVQVHDLSLAKLVPSFLFKNLKKRLVDACKNTKENCCEMADRRVQEVKDLIKPTATLAQE
jgi:phosphatidate phosphatase APP1